MQAQIVTKPAFTVVGLLLHTKPMTPEIPQLWQQFGPRMNELEYLVAPDAPESSTVHHVAYGLMGHYDQRSGMFDYMAGEAVSKVDKLPPGMSRWDVPANTYAVFESTLPTIGETMHDIYSTWLPGSDYQPVGGPDFEYYDVTFEPDDPNSKLSIYIAVAKKA